MNRHVPAVEANTSLVLLLADVSGTGYLRAPFEEIQWAHALGVS
jgi:hypothetical protein